MGILAWVVFGLIVGLIARALMPGRQSMGMIMTAVLGVVGSLVGGFVATLLTGQQMGGLHGAGFIGSVLGALAVMFIAGGAFSRRRALP